MRLEYRLMHDHGERLDAGETSPFALPGAILVLLGALVSVYWFQTPLTSSRPPEVSNEIEASSGEQTIPARLWQDPLTTARLVATTEPVITLTSEPDQSQSGSTSS